MLAAAALLYFSGIGGLWLSKRVSDDVMINNAIDYHLSHPYAKRFRKAKDGSWEENEIIPYASKDAFLAENHDCCTFQSRDPEIRLPSRFYRLRYDYAGMVFINYKSHELVAGETTTVQRGRVVYMNHDGIPIPNPD